MKIDLFSWKDFNYINRNTCFHVKVVLNFGGTLSVRGNFLKLNRMHTDD